MWRDLAAATERTKRLILSPLLQHLGLHSIEKIVVSSDDFGEFLKCDLRTVHTDDALIGQPDCRG